MKPYSNFWEDPEPLDANGYASVDINVNHPVSVFVSDPFNIQGFILRAA